MSASMPVSCPVCTGTCACSSMRPSRQSTNYVETSEGQHAVTYTYRIAGSPSGYAESSLLTELRRFAEDATRSALGRAMLRAITMPALPVPVAVVEKPRALPPARVWLARVARARQ